MSYRTMCVDWRAQPNLLKAADFYSLGPLHETRPTLGNPKGRALVAVSATLLYGPEGAPSSREYNADFYELAKAKGALTEREAWRNEYGWSSRIVDVTKRGMVSGWLALFAKHFGWADGVHLDWASAWSWAFPDMAPTDEAWNNALSGFLGGVLGTGRLAIGQQFQLTPIIMAGSGAFWEQYPTGFGSDFDRHAQELVEFRNMTSRVDGREVLFVSELREPGKFPEWYRIKMQQWASVNDIVLSWGRDSTAMVGL